MFIHAHFQVVMQILASNVGQTELALGVSSGFISKFVHARLQICVWSSYNLCYPG